MVARLIIVFIIFSIFGCSKKRSNSLSQYYHKDSAKLNELPIEYIWQDWRLYFPIGMAEDEIDKKYFFGSFYNNSVSFYKLNDKSVYVDGYLPDPITLRFSNNFLVEVTYHLDQDISEHLLRTYGNCRLIPLNEHSKKIIKNKNSSKIKLSKYKITDNLTHYCLVWTLGEELIQYQYIKNISSGAEKIRVQIKGLKMK